MTNFDIKQTILNKIKEYNKIFIFRHKRPDGDATGSTKGLQRILQLTYPDKEIVLQNCDFADYMAFLGGEDGLLPDESYAEALGIVVDTGTMERVSNQKFTLCKEVIKIDHHINIAPYGDLLWVEEERSSACEMIADFYATFKDELKIDSEAATYIYCGMVTDSGRFRFRDVSGETMRLAGMLLDIGIDTDTLYANLYMKEFDIYKFEAYAYGQMQITENGVAYLHVTKEMQEKFGLIWLAFIDNDDGSIRVRLRSRFVTINCIGEKYRGGGHACAAGATVYSVEEMHQLIADADARLKEYKENNEGWL